MHVSSHRRVSEHARASDAHRSLVERSTHVWVVRNAYTIPPLIRPMHPLDVDLLQRSPHVRELKEYVVVVS